MSGKFSLDGTPSGRASAKPEVITIEISLPASVWDGLTEDMKDFDRYAYKDAELPDMPLSERIDIFLQIEVKAWYDWIGGTPADDDLDDGVPF